MRVLGLGFRAGAGLDSLRDALRAAALLARCSPEVTLLATAADKADFPPLAQWAAELGLPVIGVPLAVLAAQAGEPRAAASARVPARYGGRSLAEAAALAVAGPTGRLLAARAVSSDGRATAALAEPAPRADDDTNDMPTQTRAGQTVKGGHP